MNPSTRRGPDIEAVAIGASSGGVEALLTVLPALPAGTAFATFVVLHLPPARPSLLVDIFSARCALPVREPSDKDPIEPGVIYVAPPDYHLLIAPGPHIALSVDEQVNFSRPSIDVLFESAAEVFGTRLVGVLLTGSSHDGAEGLATIKRAGGLTVAQDPQTAASPLMPQAALNRGAVDRVLGLEQIAALLRELGLHGLGNTKGTSAS